MKIKAIDFFCGGGGMTRGLLDAGIDVIAGIDNDPICEETYRQNNKPAEFIFEDIADLQPEELERGYKTSSGKTINIKKNDDKLLFVGCSPCQYWSVMKTDKTRSHDARNLLDDFDKFVAHFNPGYVVIENVPGLFHRRESPLQNFIHFLKTRKYEWIDHGIIHVSQHGVPQTRKRFLLIASRVTPVYLPDPEDDSANTVEKFIGNLEEFPKIPAGHIDKSHFCHTTAGLSETNLERLRRTPHDGGTREAWAKTELQLAVYARHSDNPKFGFQDVYGRMFWKRPAPTITTRFYSISNGRFAHPEQDRPISLREGATLQTFPKTYSFHADGIADIAKLIGNAVPPELAKRIGQAVMGKRRRSTDVNPTLF